MPEFSCTLFGEVERPLPPPPKQPQTKLKLARVAKLLLWTVYLSRQLTPQAVRLNRRRKGFRSFRLICRALCAWPPYLLSLFIAAVRITFLAPGTEFPCSYERSYKEDLGPRKCPDNGEKEAATYAASPRLGDYRARGLGITRWLTVYKPLQYSSKGHYIAFASFSVLPHPPFFSDAWN